MMTNQIRCPVCFDKVLDRALGRCEACGALLPHPDSEREPAPDDMFATESKMSEGEGDPKTDVDELLEAFVAQFVQDDLSVPAGWRKRLQDLALETEPSRRYATIIFVDLRGYTHLSNILSETKLKDLRAWFNATITNSVELHGGFLIQFLGDAAFAAFGAPWAFERDAESAIRCLLDIREKIEKKGTFEGSPLAIRAGAANGVINVDTIIEGGRSRPDLMGAPVNLAARLEARAETGEILIPKELALQVERIFELREKEAFTPKNYGRKVQAFVVCGEKEGDPIRRRLDTPFVGRGKEFSDLKRIISDKPKGAFLGVKILGDAGVGKTRFTIECINRFFAGRPCYWLHLQPHNRHIILSPLIQLCKKVGSENAPENTILTPKDILYEIDRKLPGLDPTIFLSIGFLLQEKEAQSALSILPPELIKATVEIGLLEFMRHIGKEEAPVLIVDDLQWIDAATLRVLQLCNTQEINGLTIIVIGRAGTGYQKSLKVPPSSEDNDIAEKLPDWPCITLSALAKNQSIQLLSGIISPHSTHPVLFNRVLEVSNGIPLYIIEMAQEIEAGGINTSDSLAESLTSKMSQEIPLSLAEIFQAKLDRLTAHQRIVLQCGAILGRRFKENILGSYQEIRDRLIDELAVLRGARLLRDQFLTDEREYVFTPSILRDFAYGMITKAHRRKLHESFADAIEEKFSSRLDDFVFELADHWLRAGNLNRARPYFRRACRKASQLGAPQDAYTLALLAIENSNKSETLLTADRNRIWVSRQQLGLLHEEAGRAARSLGDYNSSLNHFNLWSEIADEVGNEYWKRGAQHQRAITLFELGNIMEARAILDRLLTTKGASQQQQLKVQLTRANCLFRQGRYEDAAEDLRTIAGHEDIIGQVILGDSLATFGLCLQQMALLTEAKKAHEDSRAAYSRGNSSFGECLALNNIGIICETEGEFEKALAVYKEATRKAEKCGYIHALSALAANLSNLAYLRSDFEMAERWAAKSLHYARMIMHRNSEVIALINLALANEGQGFPQEAFKQISEAIQLAVGSGDVGVLEEARLEYAWIALRQGDLNCAESELDSLPSLSGHKLIPLYSTLTWLLKSLRSKILQHELKLESIEKLDDKLSVIDKIRRCDALTVVLKAGIGNTSIEKVADYRMALTK